MDAMKRRAGSWRKRLSDWWQGWRPKRRQPEAALEAFPDRVYHYTSLETVLEHILPTGQLRLSPAGYVNDPLEICAYNYAIQLATTDDVDPSWLEGGSIDLNAVGRINEVRNREWNILCMSLDHPSLTPNMKGTGYPFTLHGHGKPAMWAHYADDHRGVCLIFDAAKLHEQIVNTFADTFEIKYGSMSYCRSLKGVGFELPFQAAELVNSGPEEAIRGFIWRNHQHMLLTKHEDWNNEHEFRWLLHQPRSHSGYEYVNFGDSLQFVVIGNEVHASYIPSLKELCQSVNANLFESYWYDGDINLRNIGK